MILAGLVRSIAVFGGAARSGCPDPGCFPFPVTEMPCCLAAPVELFLFAASEAAALHDRSAANAATHVQAGIVRRFIAASFL